MAHPHNPQEREMSDESMVRNLAAQIEAIWPQERAFFERYLLPASPRVLDIGCGTGELAPRLVATVPFGEFVGVDLDSAHLSLARGKAIGFGQRARYEEGDALALAYPDASFDLVVCRHLLQALPDAARAVSEMVRVTKPGGYVHALAEDYGMLWAHPTPRDTDLFWQRVPNQYSAATGTELHIGRKMLPILSALPVSDIRVDYVTVDTLRVARDTFARIWEAWRDGYVSTIAKHSGMSEDETRGWWNDMIACVRDPRGFALWVIPVWSARKR